VTSATLRFEPIATQIAKQVSITELFPRDVLETIRHKRRASDPDAAPLPPEVDDFSAHYFALIRASAELLGAPAFAPLARRMEDLEQEYMPGGPPMSPVYDSFWMQHFLGEVPVGLSDETPFSVLVRLTSGSPERARFHALARSLAEAHLDLYRVVRAVGIEAELSPLRGGDAISVKTTGPFLRDGDLALARVLSFDGRLFVADSPYLLKASAQDWLDYFQRVVESQRKTAASARNEQPKGKLSPKQQAKWRQRQRSQEQSSEPEALIARHLKRGLSERYWFDYVMDAYAGERNGIVFAAGVPDRPEQLPHSTAYEPEQSSLPAAARLHHALQELAAHEGMLAQAAGELQQTFREAGLEPSPLDPNELRLFIAYSTLAARSPKGVTALEAGQHQWAATPELREICESVKRGGFAVMQIDRIRLDEGLEVFEARSGTKQFITERSASRQVELGDVLLGWLRVEAQGTLTLEGNVTVVRSVLGGPLLEVVRTFSPPGRGRKRGDFRDPPGLLPIQLLVAQRKLREAFMPQLRNTSGDRLQFATGRYVILDRPRVLKALAKSFTKVDEHTYDWLDSSDTRLARFEVVDTKLVVNVNSLERLDAAKARLEALLGAAVKPSLDSIDADLEEAVRAGARKEVPAPVELPPELAAQLCQQVTEQIRSTLDASIPQLNGKTLRQAARSKRSRPDAISWLRQQERILRSNPQLNGVDLRPIWQELGLEYQGLDTDPPLG